jgi:ribonuclease HI
MYDFTLSTDGGSRGNPGPSGAGAVIQDSSGATIKEISRDLGTMTNNQAEYSALIFGLEGLRELGATGKKILVRMDSELIVQQLKGVYKVKNVGLKPLYDQAKELIDDLGGVSFTHVLRHLNKRADALVNMAIDKAQGIRL